MELIIGGYAQSKLQYAQIKYELNQKKTVVLDEQSDLAIGTFAENPEVLVINHLHLIIKRMLSEGITMDELPFVVEIAVGQLRSMYTKASQVIIISDEIGNGIVPIEKADSVWREAVGRVLVLLAKDATSVERVSCGLATKIK